MRKRISERQQRILERQLFWEANWHEVQPGDYVIARPEFDREYLEAGRRYLVAKTDPQFVYLDASEGPELEGGWFWRRFDLDLIQARIIGNFIEEFAPYLSGCDINPTTSEWYYRFPNGWGVRVDQVRPEVIVRPEAVDDDSEFDITLSREARDSRFQAISWAPTRFLNLEAVSDILWEVRSWQYGQSDYDSRFMRALERSR